MKKFKYLNEIIETAYGGDLNLKQEGNDIVVYIDGQERDVFCNTKDKKDVEEIVNSRLDMIEDEGAYYDNRIGRWINKKWRH